MLTVKMLQKMELEAKIKVLFNKISELVGFDVLENEMSQADYDKLSDHDKELGAIYTEYLQEVVEEYERKFGK